jgi:hypothetical protein
MATSKKYPDNSSRVKGVDTSKPPALTPQDKWRDARDVRFYSENVEVFPGIVKYIDKTDIVSSDYVDISQEGVERFVFANAQKAYSTPSSTPNDILPMVVINQTEQPADNTKTFNTCSLKRVGTGGLGTTLIVKITATSATQFTVHNGAGLVGTFTFDREVDVTISGSTFTLGFTPSPTTDTFDNFVPGTIWKFHHQYSFVDNYTTTPTWVRWSVARWSDITYMVRGGLMYARQGNYFFPIFGNKFTTNNLHYAEYVEIYQRHLILAGGLEDGSVFWSSLNDYTDLLPTFYNEADKFPILTTRSVDDSTAYITGCKRLNQWCFIYTQNSIWRMTYVGLPRVMQVEEVTSNLGSYFKYGLVSAGNMHFFITPENFYMFDGGNTRKIGDAVQQFFFDDVTRDRVLQKNLWGFYNPRSEEVMWFYPDKTSSGDINKCISYHTTTDSWSIRNVPNVRSVVDVYYAFDLTDFQGVNTPQIGDLIYQVPGLGLGRDTRLSELTLDIWGTHTPYLETGDFTYGDPQYMKEVESLFIDCTYDGEIDVYLSARTYVGDPVQFTLVSTWSKSVKERRVSLPRSSARVFRFKFVFKPSGNSIVNRCQWYNYGENVLIKGAD